MTHLIVFLIVFNLINPNATVGIIVFSIIKTTIHFAISLCTSFLLVDATTTITTTTTTTTSIRMVINLINLINLIYHYFQRLAATTIPYPLSILSSLNKSNH